MAAGTFGSNTVRGIWCARASRNWAIQRDFLHDCSTNGGIRLRMALGAVPKDVLLMVFRSATISVAGGVLTGVVLTITLNRVLARWIQGSSSDALILSGAVLLLVVTSGSSCFIPARRASSVDPVVALRYE